MVQVKKASVREAILDSAFRLFSDKGYSGSTLAQIAENAGVSTANVYVYFASKLDIVFAIYGPWLQERLDARVRHLLIDEFQDTNPLQWHALLRWLESYVGAGSRPGVFIVGDPKQSIYRFRRAEPKVFADARAFHDGHVRPDPGAIADDDVIVDRGERFDHDVLRDLGARMDVC